MRTFNLISILESGDGTGRQHFFMQIDDCKMADVDANVIIAVVVALKEEEEERENES